MFRTNYGHVSFVVHVLNQRIIILLSVNLRSSFYKTCGRTTDVTCTNRTSALPIDMLIGSLLKNAVFLANNLNFSLGVDIDNTRIIIRTSVNCLRLFYERTRFRIHAITSLTLLYHNHLLLSRKWQVKLIFILTGGLRFTEITPLRHYYATAETVPNCRYAFRQTISSANHYIHVNGFPRSDDAIPTSPLRCFLWFLPPSTTHDGTRSFITTHLTQPQRQFCSRKKRMNL